MNSIRAWSIGVGLVVASAAGVAFAVTAQLTITAPKDGAVVMTSSVTVSGTYSGFTGDHCSINGSSNCTLFASGGETHFKGPATLQKGRNNITVIVAGGGNTVSGSVTVTYTPPLPPVRRHRRRISLFGGSNSVHTFLNGKVTGTMFGACTGHVPVTVQRLSGVSWRTVFETKTDGAGNYGKNVPNPPTGTKFRALAPKVTVHRNVCLAAKSKTFTQP
jgi:hypothetical protein